MYNRNIMKNKINLTSGNIYKKLITFAFPMFFSLLLQTFYGVVDLIVVGFYIGKDGIACIANVTSLVWVISSVGTSLSSAATVLISQYEGIKSEKDQSEVIASLGNIILITSCIVTVVTITFYKEILLYLKVPQDSINYANDYMKVMSTGWLFNFSFTSICSIIKGLGNSKVPFIFMIFSALLNMSLDYFFVGALKMETAGAALSTVFTNAICLIISYIYLKRSYFKHTRLLFIKCSKNKIKLFAKIGLPLFLQMIIVNSSYVAITKILNSYGTYIVSALGIGFQLHTLITVPSKSINQAMSIAVGQNVGANKIDQAKKILKFTLKLNILLTSAIVVLTQIFSHQIIRLFTNDPEVMRHGLLYMQMCCSLDCILYAIMTTFNLFAIGIGDTKFSCFNSLFGQVFLRLSLSYIFSKKLNMGYLGVYLGLLVSTFFPVIIGAVYVKLSKWEKRVSTYLEKNIT